MRIVAKFQFTAPTGNTEIAQSIATVLNRWSLQKFDRRSDGQVIIRRSGANAVYDNITDMLDERQRDTFTILEPVDGGNLQTEIDVLSCPDRTAFRCVLSIGSEGGIAPADISLRAPRFIREIVSLQLPWTIGISGERIFAKSFFIDAEQVSELEALMNAPQRRLPIVVVSEMLGQTLAGDLHERLSDDLCGLAHTVRLSHGGSWELTRKRGKEWSCYNGAIRLFWPFRSNSHNFRVHPLWTFDQMLANTDNEIRARDRIRGVIAERIIEASTFVADDAAFRDYEVAKVRRANDQALATAANDGDMQAIANAYAAENDVLRARLDDQDKELGILRANIETLTIALRSTEAIAPQDDINAPPQTVMEAVAIARREFGDKTVIARETDVEIDDLNPSAGPPDKILRYLRTLDDLAEALKLGALGKAVPIWLRERGIECSVDSETTKASKEGRRFRNRTINGEVLECEFHLKPSDGVSPDMCARIYFAIADAAPFVKIGYIGRHSG